MYFVPTFLAVVLAFCSSAQFGVKAQESYDFVIVGGESGGRKDSRPTVAYPSQVVRAASRSQLG